MDAEFAKIVEAYGDEPTDGERSGEATDEPGVELPHRHRVGDVAGFGRCLDRTRDDTAFDAGLVVPPGHDAQRPIGGAHCQRQRHLGVSAAIERAERTRRRRGLVNEQSAKERTFTMTHIGFTIPTGASDSCVP